MDVPRAANSVSTNRLGLTSPRIGAVLWPSLWNGGETGAGAADRWLGSRPVSVDTRVKATSVTNTRGLAVLHRFTRSIVPQERQGPAHYPFVEGGGTAIARVVADEVPVVEVRLRSSDTMRPCSRAQSID